MIWSTIFFSSISSSQNTSKDSLTKTTKIEKDSRTIFWGFTLCKLTKPSNYLSIQASFYKANALKSKFLKNGWLKNFNLGLILTLEECKKLVFSQHCCHIFFQPTTSQGHCVTGFKEPVQMWTLLMIIEVQILKICIFKLYLKTVWNF